jgi:hypothetical protein
MAIFEFVMMFLVNKSCCSVIVTSVVDMELRLKHPFCGLLTGGTGFEKTVFTFKLISEAQRRITPPPEKIIYCYGEFQEIFNDYPEVEFTEGLPDISQFDGSHRTLLIIDDLLSEVLKRFSQRKVIIAIFLYCTYCKIHFTRGNTIEL